jgi:hypothetical protein
MSSITRFVMVVVLLCVVASALVGCGSSSTPQPVCRTDAPAGQHYVAALDSVSSNNPTGVCALVDDKTGDTLSTVKGEVSFADFFAAATKKAEELASCTTTGASTTCAAQVITQ